MNRLASHISQNSLFRSRFTSTINTVYKVTTNHSRNVASTSGDDEPTEGEKKIAKVLGAKFPSGEYFVRDVSGGCGSMYQVQISDISFQGKPIVQQHRLVTQALKAEIADMHGININTYVPDHGKIQ